MSAAPKDGGPAFPNMPDGAGDKWQTWDEGMSLRDYFAGQAIIALAHDSSANLVRDADVAYQIADAMLAARAVPAAPDPVKAELLAQLKDAVRDLEHSGYAFDHPALVKHRAAIARAEGTA